MTGRPSTHDTTNQSTTIALLSIIPNYKISDFCLLLYGAFRLCLFCGLSCVLLSCLSSGFRSVNCPALPTFSHTHALELNGIAASFVSGVTLYVIIIIIIIKGNDSTR